jgi:hypothetical protein
VQAVVSPSDNVCVAVQTTPDWVSPAVPLAWKLVVALSVDATSVPPVLPAGPVPTAIVFVPLRLKPTSFVAVASVVVVQPSTAPLFIVMAVAPVAPNANRLLASLLNTHGNDVLLPQKHVVVSTVKQRVGLASAPLGSEITPVPLGANTMFSLVPRVWNPLASEIL